MAFRSDCTEGSKSAEKADLRALFDDVRKEWRVLWRDRIDDRVRAEGLANRNYSLLFVERGTVIVATRDFKLLDLKEILRSHEIKNVEAVIPPHPSIGGWGKFARSVVNKQRRANSLGLKSPLPRRNRKNDLQRKKGGMGWLHYHMGK